MGRPANPECERYWRQMVREAETDARSSDPDDTVFYRTIIMVDAQLRYYLHKLEDLTAIAKEGLK